jgi:GDP/UDP-N,N'-diacetylbacillosamine 2-epimerase (hydrolysing)
MIREKLHDFIKHNTRAVGIESLGTIGYLSCMKHCSFMLGNTSSGFIEAAFFPKYVINLGNRQNGRIVTPNIRNTAIKKEDIKNAIDDFIAVPAKEPISIYGDGHAAEKIVNILKTKA